MRVIPAIDILQGKCVRLTKGKYDTSKVYRESPLDMAKEYEDVGVKYLHVVDLDGAKSNQIVNYEWLEKIANQTDLEVDFGGGVKSTVDLEIALNSGARQVTGGSIAVNKPDLFVDWLDKYGDRIILGADAKNRMIASMGWTKESDIDVIEWIKKFENNGLAYTICTDIDKDGMLEGPSIDLYKEILKNSNVKLIASGGVRSIADIQELEMIGCEGVIVGKAIYEGRISMKELRELC